MIYNSIDDFLRKQESAIHDLVERVEHQIGGHYAALAPEQLRQIARRDATDLIVALRTDDARQMGQQQAQEMKAAGAPLAQITRMGAAMECALVTFVGERLTAQPNLRDELLRRVERLASRYRANIVAVMLDNALQRLRKD